MKSAKLSLQCSRRYLLDCIEALNRCDELSNPTDLVDFEALQLSYQQLRNRRLLLLSADEVDKFADNDEGSAAQGKIPAIADSPKGSNLPDPLNPLETISDADFPAMFGFRKSSVIDILKHIEFGWRNDVQFRSSYLPLHSILITLYFLVNGTLAYKLPAILSDMLCRKKISQPAVSRTISKVASLLADLRLRFVKLPTAARVQAETIAAFKALGGLSGVIGCVGSTQIAIRTPPRNACTDYLNEDGTYSYRFAAVCGPKMEFSEISTRWPGSSNENNIFNLSEINQKLEANAFGDSFVVASSKYSGSGFVLTPRNGRTDMTPAMMRFNESHRLTYIFPQSIKLLKRRFQCLRTVLRCKDGKIGFIWLRRSDFNMSFHSFRDDSVRYGCLCCTPQYCHSPERAPAAPE